MQLDWQKLDREKLQDSLHYNHIILTEKKLFSALDLAANSNVQDAFVIAVEQQARERLERLSALKRIKPVDMTKLSQQVSAISYYLDPLLTPL